MIVSIGINHPAADVNYEFIWVNPEERPPTPKYNDTLLQLADLAGIDKIVIPHKPNSLYSVRDIVEHIRLADENLGINRAPIFVVIENESDFDEVQNEIEDIGNAVTFLYPGDKTVSNEPPITDEAYRKLLPLLGRNPQFTDRHSLANIWGPFRILYQLTQLGYAYPDIDTLRAQISEDVYFKQLLQRIEASKTDTANIQSQFDDYFKLIKACHPRVAVIDDDYLKGWDKAYKALFPQCSLQGFQYDEGEPHFDMDSASKYDLIILDLRLTETSEHNEADITEIDEMSGIQKLEEIRKIDPVVPIIMCTASNKSWSYQTALDYGANGYWEKESPDFGIGADYNLKNTLNLINTINEVMSWSKEIKPIFEKFDRIISLMKRQELRDRIIWKRDVIAGQLHNPPSKYVREHFHLDSERVAFLVAWSIVNEMTQYYKIGEFRTQVSTMYDGDEEGFCSYVPDTKGNDKLRLSDFAVSLINRPGDSKYFNENQFEFLFMKFLFYLAELEGEYRTYFRLRKVRNTMDYVHGTKIGKKGEPYQTNDLIKMVGMWEALLNSQLGSARGK
jgi:CheY-like chemotaxis protein